MKVDYRIIVISLFCGVFFWVASAVLDYLYYGDQYSFHDLLIKGIPHYESYLRSAIFAFFMLFGLLMSRAVVKIRQANLTLKESQEKLQAQNELLNRVMESLTHPFYVVDVDDYSIGMANSAAYRNGVSTGHMCYETVHQYSAPCSEIGEFCPIEEVKKTKTPMVFEHVNYDTNGNPRNIEIHVYPIFDNQGNIIQLIEYCIDITERRQTEKSLESERPDKTTPHLLKRRNSYKENRANIRFYKRICNVCTERFQHQS